MASPQLYTKVDISISGSDGSLVLLQDTDVRMTRDSGLKELYALGANDLVGAKQGAKKLTAEWNSQVPFDNFEYDTGEDQQNGTFVSVTFSIGGGSKTLTSQGIIKTDELSDSVEGEAKYKVTFVGQWASWQG